MNSRYPVFGICGFSGSGKTTVIEKVVEQLAARGLQVGVVKHDVHGLKIDCEGKDSDRFFKAGADVVMRGPEQCFFRMHRRGDIPLDELIRLIGPHYDLVLVEGHKTTPLDQKVWLCGEAGETPPPEAAPVRRVLGRDEDRVGIVMEMIDAWLPGAWRDAPLYAGVLIGGMSSRFGRPKHLVDDDGKTWLERTVDKVRSQVDGIVILGKGEIPGGLGSIPVLCDVEDAEGPLAGMLAATRWRPLTSWVFLPCDLPLLSEEAIRWLLTHREPGAWAVLPQLPGAPSPEPLLAYYDFRAAPLLERLRRPSDLATADRAVSPEIPGPHRTSWENINTMDRLAEVCGCGGGRCVSVWEESEVSGFRFQSGSASESGSLSGSIRDPPTAAQSR